MIWRRDNEKDLCFNIHETQTFLHPIIDLSLSNLLSDRDFIPDTSESVQLLDQEIPQPLVFILMVWTLSNFKTLFQDTLYLRWYWNTLIVAFFTMLIQVTVITLTGYAYSRYNFFGRKKV